MTNKAIGTEDAIKRLVQETDAHWEKHGNNINPRSKRQAGWTIFAELVKCSDEQIFLKGMTDIDSSLFDSDYKEQLTLKIQQLLWPKATLPVKEMHLNKEPTNVNVSTFSISNVGYSEKNLQK